jgi:hypothetical protein
MSLDKRRFDIKPDFLEGETCQAITWCDAPDSDKNPKKLVRDEIACRNNSDIHFDVMPGGGFVAILKPELK